MRTYISGPINSPIPTITPEQCRANFYKAATMLKEDWLGVTPVIPLEVPPKCLKPILMGKDAGKCGGEFDGHKHDCWMRGDIIAMMECDSILMLPGWSQSRGANTEYNLAVDLGFRPLFMSQDMGRIHG